MQATTYNPLEQIWDEVGSREDSEEPKIGGLRPLFDEFFEDAEPTIDYEISEAAGAVVEAENFEKRVRVLIHQLPETVVGCIEHCGIWTPGLKPMQYDPESPEAKIIDKRWYAKDGVDFEPRANSKLEYLELLQKTAIDFLPKQSKYTRKDVEDTFDNYYARIACALIETSEHEQIVRQIDNLGRQAYDTLLRRRHNPNDVKSVLERIISTWYKEMYADLNNAAHSEPKSKAEQEHILNKLIRFGDEGVGYISRPYA